MKDEKDKHGAKDQTAKHLLGHFFVFHAAKAAPEHPQHPEHQHGAGESRQHQCQRVGFKPGAMLEG
ncbi:hypothetical protein VCRA2119O147_320012 [Vibrio crassostreae]|nr:hypothetical protein VCRA2116O28_140050 [Vibrio crassostreae]CAK1778059.1 hypothetical protein VCRA2119O46_150049 [Vibrio crassostreae]CAK1782119.1 hypothetical protein VCRA2117O38_150110 [Vibrio crassostreae]CAK1804331.1 hypothetical protein VCRA2119O145_190020 [Vibrio crassostreae]CAK2292626.1 hypothetical protein VCRA2119O50_150050 [Vibrio crassostreae]